MALTRETKEEATGIKAAIEYEMFLNRKQELPDGFHFSDGFFHYEKEQKDEFYNWKFHISVQHEDVATTYDLIVGILKKYFSAFKVIEPNCRSGSRCYDEAQFTIYLFQEDEENVAKVEAALNELNSVMVKNGIRKGRTPKADAPLRAGEYFSLRNDGTRTFQRRDSEGYYFQHDKVGRHYNPICVQNPFARLLKYPDKPFNLVRYFKQFEATTLIEVYQALACTCLAYLNTCTAGGATKVHRDIEILTGKSGYDSDDEAKGVQHPALSISTNPANIMAYFLSELLSGRPYQNFITALSKISLYSFYQIDDEFGRFLQSVDAVKARLPRCRGEEVVYGATWTQLYPGTFPGADLLLEENLKYCQQVTKDYLELESAKAKLIASQAPRLPIAHTLMPPPKDGSASSAPVAGVKEFKEPPLRSRL